MGREAERILEGVVLRAHSGRCLVAAGGAVHDCRFRGRLKHGERRTQAVVVAGDRVRFRPVPRAGDAGPQGVIEEVLPRRNRIGRRASRRSGGRREQVLMANLDQVVAVQSLREPAPQSGLVDRLLVAAERYGVAGLLCLNKCDLDPAAARDPLWDHYRAIGYEVIRTSAVSGEGVRRLAARLRDRISILLGVSGVGKSSLLNAIDPGLDLRIAPVTPRSGLGRHTTTRTELFPLADGGFIADSPGVRGFDPWDIAPADLGRYFPDWREPATRCRFRTCLHRHEPDCGVKEAVAAGEIPRRRYEAYVSLLADLEASAREERSPR